METQKYIVQSAQHFRKFKSPRFRFKPNDVIWHRSGASMGFLDFLYMSSYLLYVKLGNRKFETVSLESKN